MLFTGEGQSEAISLAEAGLKVMKSIILSFQTAYRHSDGFGNAE